MNRSTVLATVAAGLILISSLSVVACGGDGSDSSSDAPQKATLVLDFIPNGVHAGIYEAEAKGYYDDNGIDLKIIEPTSTADTLRLILAGKADFGLADGVDLAQQIDAGRPAKGFMAVLQRPAGGLVTLADANIMSPRDLAGKKVGVTGVPSDNVIFDQIVEDAGGNPEDSDLITIGFTGVQALQSGGVSAFTGYVPADATAVEADGQKTRSFLLDDNGGPSYPGLVAFSTEDEISSDPDLMKGFVEATTKGYQDALADPKAAADALASQADGVDPKIALDTFDAYVPLIGASGDVGVFDDQDLTDLSDFLIDGDLIKEPIAPDRYATNEFTSAG